jgi:phage major capsid protein, HK97 family|nr:MAG TPA: major capsid protein [Caudoviricetes sp.]DAT73249.1 MAG TPA: major capsid protein [Caudoviricetes sp.]
MNEKMKALQEQRNAAVEELKALTAKVEAEVRAFTEEEDTKFTELEQKVKDLDASIDKLERASSYNLTENTAKEEKKEEEKEEVKEERAFENYIRGIVLEERADNLTAGDNGAVIPKTIANKIIQKVHEISPVFNKATRYNVKGDLSIPYYPADAKDIQMAFVDEFVELESSAGKFGSINLKGFLAGALSKVSKSLVNNSQFDITSFVVNKMAETVSLWIEGILLKGATGKVDGMIKGITQSVTSKAVGKVDADDLIALQDSVPDAYQGNACWIMSRATRTAIRLLKDGDGKYLLNQDATTKWGYTLFGKPVYVSENMDEIATGKNAVLYGDLSGLAVKLSEDMEVQVLREKFATQHAIGVVAWMEFDAKVENAQKLAKLTVK